MDVLKDLWNIFLIPLAYVLSINKEQFVINGKTKFITVFNQSITEVGYIEGDFLVLSFNVTKQDNGHFQFADNDKTSYPVLLHVKRYE